MGRIWESINSSTQHMLTHVPNGQIAGSPLWDRESYLSVFTALGYILGVVCQKYKRGKVAGIGFSSAMSRICHPR